MKKLILVCILFATTSAFSEDPEIYNAWIKIQPIDSAAYYIRGVMYDVTDTSVILSNSLKLSDYKSNNYTFKEYDIKNIELIKFRKKYKQMKYLVAGAIVGLTSSALLINSAVNEENPLAGTIAIFYGILSLPVSIGVGGIFGSIKTNYYLNKDLNTYSKYKQTFEQYSIEKQMNLPDNNLRE